MELAKKILNDESKDERDNSKDNLKRKQEK
jgi:hypothetical protein